MDWEFIEDGVTIEPISIGLSASDGRELYLINRDVNMDRMMEHNWLNPNVTRYLPVKKDGQGWTWDDDHGDDRIVSKSEMRARILDFFRKTASPRTWAWWAAHDQVTLGNLFGSFIQMPMGIPQRCNDVAQEVERLGIGLMPSQSHETQHHALYDARFVLVQLEWTREVERQTLAKRFQAWKDGDENLASISW